MYEVEVKVPADLEAVRRRVTQLEAESLGTVVQEDTYYDAPHRSFADTDEALRIRCETVRDGAPVDGESEEREPVLEAHAKITYKGPLIDDTSKTREEVETGVEDEGKVDDILEHLGFEPVATVQKERERYALAGYTITLDTVDGVGEFVEVETDADENAIETARDGAFSVLERLGLDPDDQLRASYLELLLEDAS